MYCSKYRNYHFRPKPWDSQVIITLAKFFFQNGIDFWMTKFLDYFFYKPTPSLKTIALVITLYALSVQHHFHLGFLLRYENDNEPTMYNETFTLRVFTVVGKKRNWTVKVNTTPCLRTILYDKPCQMLYFKAGLKVCPNPLETRNSIFIVQR